MQANRLTPCTQEVFEVGPAIVGNSTSHTTSGGGGQRVVTLNMAAHRITARSVNIRA